MTREEFEAKMKEFFNWASGIEREETSWFASLENWAKEGYDRASVAKRLKEIRDAKK